MLCAAELGTKRCAHLIGEGDGPTAIAQKLGVAVKTIETHQMRMREKLRIKTTSELRRAALHAQLFEGALNRPKKD